MRDNDIMEGITDTAFEPTRPILRCEFAAMIVRTYMYVVSLINTAVPNAKLSLPSRTVTKYLDVPVKEWYYNYAEKAQQFGLMHGDEDGNFRPEENINRAEGAAVFNRLFKAVDKALEEIR